MAAFVAHRAVQGVVQHEPLDDVFAEIHGLRVGGGDHHAVFGLHHAAHLHPFHRPLQELDGAHPAGAQRAQGRVVAEAGDHDPQALRGLEHVGALRDFDFPVIDDELRHGDSL